MKRALVFALAAMVFGAAPALANQFSNWAVLIVAGDDRAHDGSPAQVFDNARRDLAKQFASIGFSPANMVEFSVDPAPDAQPTDVKSIADALWDVSNRATGGCLIYFTSHGSPDGIVTGDRLWAPDKFANVVNNACGSKPSVVVMSACFTGIFLPPLQAPNRMVMSAARPDRTSFGCGNDFKYTFFDQCFLQSLPASGDFPGAAELTRACVSKREHDLGAEPPSEPQLSVGDKVASALRWR
jgi:hypothetical protein